MTKAVIPLTLQNTSIKTENLNLYIAAYVSILFCSHLKGQRWQVPLKISTSMVYSENVL